VITRLDSKGNGRFVADSIVSSATLAEQSNRQVALTGCC
jgi:hypothetical protein